MKLYEIPLPPFSSFKREDIQAYGEACYRQGLADGLDKLPHHVICPECGKYVDLHDQDEIL
jgi:Fe2+ or Zn2+ uptake regulation protein